MNDEFVRRAEDYAKGYRRGQVSGLEKHKKILIEVWEKINDLQKQLDDRVLTILNALAKLEYKIKHHKEAQK